MRFSKIYILGAGAIGSLFGALLSQKNKVELIGEKEHILKINSQGLKVKGSINKKFYLKGNTEIKEIPENCLILLTTKAHQVKKAIEKIKNLVKNDTKILVLQNGLGQEKIIEKILTKKCEIIRAITYIACEFLKPGEIKCWIDKKTILPNTKTAKKISILFKEANLKVILTKNLKKEIWRKLIVNSLIGPLTALFQVRNHEIAKKELKKVRLEILREGVKVAEKEGIKFEKNFIERVEKKLKSYTNFSSMCQDILKKRKTEIDFLNGKIIELAKKHKIEVPINETIYHLIKFLEEKS